MNMKSSESYKITAVRLVEFHNLGTTTIEIPEGGHLFLLGDNGSGKTTILDAVHLVLTAGREMEFNSAARVAGSKDSGGRTYQGIVLRYNAVTGRTAREAGITYAALELKSDNGRVCSLVVGLSARGMDVQYERWGGIASVGVSELPLMIEDGGRLRAASQSEFKRDMSNLTGGKYYPHINDYANAVGTRLFGGEAKYADVCKLLRTGKAYREIAARAANYDDLFRQLLEDPSRDTFEPLLKGLHEIEESKGKLDQIDERANYLNDLLRESEKLGALRLKTDIAAWTECEQKRNAAAESVASLKEAEEEGRKLIDDLEREWADLKGEVARSRERLQDLRAKDKTGLIDREKSAAQRFAEASRKAQEAEQNLLEMRRLADIAAKADKDARAKRHAALKKGADELIAAGKSADFSVGSLVDALYGAEEDVDSVFSSVRAEISSERECRSKSAFRARIESEASAQESERCRVELEEIRSRGENMPDVSGFREVRLEVRSQMLAARPLYELLEPAFGCDARHLALLERLIGDDFLATWLTRADEADKVKQIVWRNGGEIAVAVRETLSDVSVSDIAPWLGAFVSFEESDVEAVQLLAQHLAGKTGPSDGGFLSQKTWLFRGREGLSPSVKPRLIGRKAREAEQLRLERAAEARLAEAEKAEKIANKKDAALNTSLEQMEKLEEVFYSVLDMAKRETEAMRSAALAAERAQERVQSAMGMASERRDDANVEREELEDIRIKMRSQGIDGTLEKRIAVAERALRSREAEVDEKSRDIGDKRGKLDGIVNARAKREAEVKTFSDQAKVYKAKFEAQIPAGMETDKFAFAKCPECKESSLDYALFREQLAKESGSVEARIDQRIRDPKGEPYAFSFERSTNKITDRRGSSLVEVLADETHRLDELRGVLDRKSREVFERIFMGEVMRHLYTDLMRITDLTGRIQRKLSGRRFGANRYQFGITPVPEYEHFVELVRKGYALDSGDEKDELRDYLSYHREEILNAEINEIPPIFDYRRWFRFELKVVTENEEGRVIDRKVKSMGSGGEQAVPNYLLILTVAEFLYHGGTAADMTKASPILFDEAFYGIDAARRDQLLAFADDLGLQLFVSSPDQDGVKREIKHSVSLIVIKDENLDVHLTPVVWRNVAVQADLLDDASPEMGMTVKEETR